MLFPASDRAEFITGVTQPVDDGYAAWVGAGDACGIRFDRELTDDERRCTVAPAYLGPGLGHGKI